jgi:hypothetical protein
MAQIKLLSIKRNEEASYFYAEKNDSATLDSNRNVEVQENHDAPHVSTKARKEEERMSKKVQKQKIKEMKQREKEKRKSLINSRKEIVGSVDTLKRGDPAETKINGGFQVGINVNDAAKNKSEESLNDNEEPREEPGEIRHEHEEASNQHEDLNKEHELVSSELSITTHDHSTRENVEIPEHATSSKELAASGETRASSSEGHADLESGSKSRLEKPREVEETITMQSAHSVEDAPTEIFHHPKINPAILESDGGQHLEIEISEVTDFDDETSGSDQVIVMQNTSTYQNTQVIEGEILVATVQQVESGLDLDDIFAECNGTPDEEDKEEKRKSVRFQEETEEIGRSEEESNDHEHASINIGGDFTGTSDDDSVRPPLEPAVEIVSKEERSKNESCVDLDHVFAASEQEVSATETVPEQNHVGMVKVNGDTKVNGSTKVNGKTKVGNGDTKMDELVEINLNESNENKNTATTKKEKRKKSGLIRCCFP